MRRGAWAATSVLVLLALQAAGASAAPTDAPILIRSLSPGLGGNSAAEYVMLQMTVPGQQQLTGETLTFYGPGGNVTRSFPIPANVSNGQSQRTILLATQQAAATGGFPAPDFDLGSGGSLDPAGGAVCLSGPYPADCATWGSLPAVVATALPDPQEVNADVIYGESLGRPIGSGCATWLDPADDRIHSGGTFFDGVPPPGALIEPAPPSPRNNSTTPSESFCQVNTIFNFTPTAPTNDNTPTFSFAESPAEYEVTYRCRFGPGSSLSAGVTWSLCPSSGNSFGPLADGTYTFQAYATGVAGPDPTPANWTFDVDTVPPNTFIDSVPPEPSNGFSESFGFHSSEPLSKFQCQYESGPLQSCDEGKTLYSLPDGTHTLRVWAIDQAGNVDPTPAVAVFSVDTSLGDVSPPETTLLSRPPNPSTTGRAAFTYRSSESRSSFACSLDGAAYAACDPAGASYSGLANGSHSFKVRATDRAGNTDSVPASFSWVVKAPLPHTRITRFPPGFQKLSGGERKLTVTFAFRSDEPAGSFRCRLDGGKFKRCRSPLSLRAAPGRHRFEVYAVDAVGNAEASPVRRIFRVGAAGPEGFFRMLGGGLR